MKHLQNNFTTPEQFKRLLELGLPADSADCYYSQTCRAIVTTDDEMNKKEFYKAITPVWSVGRLIEIYSLCNTHGSNVTIKPNSFDSIVEQLITMFETKNTDFSKLED